jgi:Glycosyl transferase family 2
MIGPTVSVIVTCYNYGRYVASALDSALAQAYPHKEIIVVDDGSTDDAASVIARYAGRVKVITQANAGSIAAYNRGFAESRGEIIVLLDADDVLEPNALDSVVAVWSPSVAKVQWELRIIGPRGEELGRKFCHFDGNYDASRVRESFRRTGTYRWPVSVGNAYARWFARELFPLSPQLGPDGALNSVAPVYGEVLTIPRALACYRVHGKNLWSSTGSDAARLPARIAQRERELDVMQQHAARRGVTVPDTNPLDHEIAFLNYRLMAKALHLDYSGAQADSRWRLLHRAYQLLWRERYPWRLSLSHGLWFGALSVSPEAAARRLIRLRFQRGDLKQRVLGALRSLRQPPREAS